MDKRVLITGGSGMIGKNLSRMLLEKGYAVSWLSRREDKNSKIPTYQWDIDKGTMNAEALENADYVIHLAGANVGAKRWTSTYKKEILESRTKSSKLLYENLQSTKHSVKALISASAIGIYGNNRGNELLFEESSQGNDFLAQVTKEWEQATNRIESLGIRVVQVRIGIVMSREEGALAKMAAPVRLGAGAALGSGTQMVSWIHEDDLCSIFIKAIEDESFSGPYNAVAPIPVTNSALTKTIAKTLGKPLILPNVPAFVLKMILGEFALSVLASFNISSKKLQDAGFQFKFNTIDKALQDLLTE